MNRFIWCTLILFLPLFPVKAQESDKPIDLVYQSTMLGIGRTSIYDTYLSQTEYYGTTLGLFHEQIKMTGMMKGKVSAQHLFYLDFSSANNPSETATDYSAFINYDYGLHYRMTPAKDFNVFAGAQANAMIGFIYNNRNGNNPASAKLHANLNLSLIASYQLRIKRQPFNIRYQVNTPFVGVMFSPHYGQSYYEISLGDNNNLAYFSSFHNQVTLDNTFSLEIPFDFATIRLSYRNMLYQTDINDIQTKIHSNSFFIGFSKSFFSVSGKNKNTKYKRVFE